MLGPSGSGKTTCLRMIAGFDRPTAGKVYLHGANVTALPPYERDVNTVFQDYALFPHMTVGDNIAYGLKIRKVPASRERQRAPTEMLDLVRLPGYASRKPSQLSGGQRQRVALARALINQPRVLLLDEPLGALDLKLRQQMQVELKGLQQRLGITFIFVTHDQEEALSMSDRIAVFNQGKIEQIGGPAEIYENPQTAFVANFVGTSNMITGDMALQLAGTAALLPLRPEKIHLVPVEAPVSLTPAASSSTVIDVDYLGLFTRYHRASWRAASR
jgi:putative spermidine/putrescine transport system ATP-binding protein